MIESEWVACPDPNQILKAVGLFPQSERKWICASLICWAFSLKKPDWIALELEQTMAKYADGIISRSQVEEHFETAQRGNGRDVEFSQGETVLYLNQAIISGANQKNLAAALRDIFGNPFRPITLDPSWLTPTVKALAQTIYANRTFDRLPLLADELVKSGCTNQEILGHCRGPGPHVRGCWVVDLILVKE